MWRPRSWAPTACVLFVLFGMLAGLSDALMNGELPNRFDPSATLARHAVYRRWMEILEWTHTTWHPDRIQGFTDMA